MANYNIIRNSIFESITTSGTGNRLLNATELEALTVGPNTTYSGVPLVSSDVLYLDVDMGNRLKIDGIYLYADDLTEISNIDFFYKNIVTDSYTSCAKSTSVLSYNAEIPYPSAPRYIRCTISGTSLNILQFKILNDDTVVNFGLDGTETVTWLDDTPLGSYGAATPIEIYNDSSTSKTATAYVCVDFTGADKDHYIDIAVAEEGPYSNLKDSTLIGKSGLPWPLGKFYNTRISEDHSNAIVLNSYNILDYGYPNNIGKLPILNLTYPYKPFGMANAISYDHINNKVYAMFWTSSSADGSHIRLYMYDPVTNVWTFRGELLSPYWDAYKLAMSCDQNYVYFVTCLSDYITYVYKHDPLGALGNLTLVVNLDYVPGSKVMAADFKGNTYVYSAALYQQCPSRTFIRVDMSTGSYEYLSIDYYCSQIGHINHILRYDYDRDVLYLLFSSEDEPMNRYTVSTGTWDAHFLDYANRLYNTTSVTYMSFSYYNNKLYFISAVDTTPVKVFNLLTEEITTIEIIRHEDTAIRQRAILVIPPQIPDVDETFYLFNVLEDPNDIFGKNTGFEPYTDYHTVVREGTYTTPIIALEDSLKASYFIIDSDSEEGETSVSKATDLYDGTIEVRSSSVKPTTINEIYWPYTKNGHDIFVYKSILGSGHTNPEYIEVPGSRTMRYCLNATVCKKTGTFFSSSGDVYYGYDEYMTLYDREGNVIKHTIVPDAYTINFSSKAYFGAAKDLWVFSETAEKLVHYDINLSILNEYVTSDVKDFTVSEEDSSVWFIDGGARTIKFIDTHAELIMAVNLTNPTSICMAGEGFCWVVDFYDPTYGSSIKKYSPGGDLVLVIPTTANVLSITEDTKGGFFALTEFLGEVWHYTSTGDKVWVMTGLGKDDEILAGLEGFVLYSKLLHRVRYIDYATKTIVWSRLYNQISSEIQYIDTCMPAFFSFDLSTEQKYRYNGGAQLIPASYDSYWQTRLTWRTIPKDGYFLPKTSYHQLRITLRSEGAKTPVINNIALAPVVQITDIKPKESRPVYIRSNIPGEANDTQFDTRLKVWWDIED